MKAFILIALLSTSALACEVESFTWKPADYSNKVVQLHVSTKGCERNQTLVIKLYEKDEFVGGLTVYIDGNYAYAPVTVSHPIKSKLQMRSTIYK
jgi:hypothetical protein